MYPLVPIISQFSYLLQIHMLPFKFPWWLGVKGDQWAGRGRNVCCPPAFAVSSSLRSSHGLSRKLCATPQRHQLQTGGVFFWVPGVPTPDRWYRPPKFTISIKPNFFAMESLPQEVFGILPSIFYFCFFFLSCFPKVWMQLCLINSLC